MKAKNPHAVALGRSGGRVKSEAKARAARANGRKGGAPKKISISAALDGLTAEAMAILSARANGRKGGAKKGHTTTSINSTGATYINTGSGWRKQ